MRLQVIRGVVVPLEVTRLPQVLATSRSPQAEVLQERPPGCKQVVAERVAAAALAEEAVVVEQERVAAVPLPQIAAPPVPATQQLQQPPKQLRPSACCTRN